jgi:hypothetical protein
MSLELGQSRARPDPVPIDPAWDCIAELDELVGPHKAVTEQRQHLRSARERDRAVAERRSSGLG